VDMDNNRIDKILAVPSPTLQPTVVPRRGVGARDNA
jgi:hypothetical protein